jgi:hypothetical protein
LNELKSALRRFDALAPNWLLPTIWVLILVVTALEIVRARFTLDGLPGVPRETGTHRESFYEAYWPGLYSGVLSGLLTGLVAGAAIGIVLLIAEQRLHDRRILQDQREALASFRTALWQYAGQIESEVYVPHLARDAAPLGAGLIAKESEGKPLLQWNERLGHENPFFPHLFNVIAAYRGFTRTAQIIDEALKIAVRQYGADHGIAPTDETDQEFARFIIAQHLDREMPIVLARSANLIPVENLEGALAHIRANETYVNVFDRYLGFLNMLTASMTQLEETTRRSSGTPDH